MGKARPGQSGLSLIEVMTALMIALLSAMAFFQLFAFGAVELEKLGYRREAMGLLQGELEFWRARFQATGSGESVPPSEADARKRRVESASGMVFDVDPEVAAALHDRDLRFQRVRVRVSYARLDLADTLEIETRQYVR